MMNATFPYLSVDQRWYTRPPGCGDRITAGGVVFRLDANERVLVALDTVPKSVSAEGLHVAIKIALSEYLGV